MIYNKKPVVTNSYFSFHFISSFLLVKTNLMIVFNYPEYYTKL